MFSLPTFLTNRVYPALKSFPDAERVLTKVRHLRGTWELDWNCVG